MSIANGAQVRGRDLSEPRRPTKAEAIANLIEIYAAILADPIRAAEIRKVREQAQRDAKAS